MSRNCVILSQKGWKPTALDQVQEWMFEKPWQECWHEVFLCMFACLTPLLSMRNGKRGHQRTSQIWGTVRERKPLWWWWRFAWWIHHVPLQRAMHVLGSLSWRAIARGYGGHTAMLEASQPNERMLCRIIFVAGFQHHHSGFVKKPGFQWISPCSRSPLPPLFFFFSPRQAVVSHMLRDHSIRLVTAAFPTNTRVTPQRPLSQRTAKLSNLRNWSTCGSHAIVTTLVITWSPLLAGFIQAPQAGHNLQLFSEIFLHWKDVLPQVLARTFRVSMGRTVLTLVISWPFIECHKQVVICDSYCNASKSVGRTGMQSNCPVLWFVRLHSTSSQ